MITLHVSLRANFSEVKCRCRTHNVSAWKTIHRFTSLEIHFKFTAFYKMLTTLHSVKYCCSNGGNTSKALTLNLYVMTENFVFPVECFPRMTRLFGVLWRCIYKHTSMLIIMSFYTGVRSHITNICYGANQPELISASHS